MAEYKATEPQEETIREMTPAQDARGFADDEDMFVAARAEGYALMTQRDPLSSRLNDEELAAMRVAILQSHATYLGTIVRSLLDRLYAAKVGCGDLPSDQLMPRIQGELENIQAVLDKLTEQGGAG